jgi:hypothetical protein
VVKVVSIGALPIGIASDYYLTTHIDPKTGQPYLSHDRFGANTTVSIAAVIIGSGPGILIETGWAINGVIFTYVDSNYPHAYDMNANPAIWKN